MSAGTPSPGDRTIADAAGAEPARRPEEVLDDRLRRRVLWALPTGLYVVGSAHGRRANLMTANLAVQVATAPKLVAVALDATSVTRGLVAAGGCFSLSLLARDDRAVVRRFAKPVPEDDVVYDAGRLAAMAGEEVEVHRTGAPVLARAVAWLDCEVRHRVELGSHELAIGEVVDVGGPEDEIPPLLRMEDTRMNYGG